MVFLPYNFGPVYDDLNSKVATFSTPVVSTKSAVKAAMEGIYNQITLQHSGLANLSYDENAALVRGAAVGFFVPAAVNDPVADAKIDAVSKAVAQKIYDALDSLATTNAVPLDELVALLFEPERVYVTDSLMQFRLRRSARLVKLQNTERNLLDQVAETGVRAVPGSMVQKLAELFSEAELEDSSDLLELQRAYNAEEQAALAAIMDTLASGMVRSAAVGIFRLGVQAFTTQREVALSLRQAQYAYAGAVLRKNTEVDTFTDKLNGILMDEIRRRMELDAQRKKLVDLTEYISKTKIQANRAEVEAANKLVAQVNNMVKLQVTTGLSQAITPLYV